MGKDDVCACASPAGFTWHLSPCDEAGWHCSSCRLGAPGEPPGYRPDLDVSEIEEKVSAVLMEMHARDLIYVSNSGHGESIVNAAVSACGRSGRYDQGSIIRFLMSELSDGSFWKERGDAIRAGEDMRDRCPCGELATSWTVSGGGHPPVARCIDHGMGQLIASMAMEPGQPGDPDPLDPWEAYGLWEAKWREDHPDDERESLELIDEYGKMSAEELRAFFDGIERERAEKGAGNG